MPDLLVTKLHHPSIPPRRVTRPRLNQRLTDGMAGGCQLTLVSAPAGFGKTLCVCEWLAGLDLPSAWLALEPADDEPVRFFTYLLAAIQKVDPGLGKEIEGILRSGHLPPGEAISTTLINDMLKLPGRLILALDDFHLIQNGLILQVIEKLVGSAPPALHLVLLTREDPPLALARLRANQKMTEIRAEDLRFSKAEAIQFLNEVMDLSISQGDAAALEERTEGWAVGLQLAGLSMRGRADLAEFIARLSGSHRYILGYLTEEVLNHQPEEIKDFLLQTSILDRLSGELCDAVCARSGSHALLERLYNANLFLTPLDDEKHWYRYHRLFADLLRDLQNRQPGSQTQELHRRASAWYAAASLKEDGSLNSGGRAELAGEAIEHALLGGDPGAAGRLVEQHAMDQLMQWSIKPVEKWVQSLPEECIQRSPKLNLIVAWLHIMNGTFAQAAPYLQRLHEHYSAGGQAAGEKAETIPAEWLALQALLLNGQGRPEQGLALARRALESAPEASDYLRCQIYLGMAGAYKLMDDYAHTVEAYQAIARLGRTADDAVIELLGNSAIGLMAIEHGQLHLAVEIATQSIERVERLGFLPPISTAVYGELGQTYYQWRQLELARKYLRRSTEVCRLTGYQDAEIYELVVASRLLQSEGALGEARQVIEQALELSRAETPVAVHEEVLAQLVCVLLAVDELAAAETALAGQCELRGLLAHREGEGTPWEAPALVEPAQIASFTFPISKLYNSHLRIALYRAARRREQASLQSGLELAGQVIAETMARQYLPTAIEAYLLRAQLHAAAGNEDASLEDYARAVELGEAEGFRTVYVEEGQAVADALARLLESSQPGSARARYLQSILAAFPGAGPSGPAEPGRPAAAALPEPLTERELEVLRLVAEGLKYEEIAGRLYISLNTVRTHVKAIYGKLGVDSRARAVALAQQLNLL